MFTEKLIICLCVVFVVCLSITGLTFYDEYKFNKNRANDDPEKESNLSLFLQCFMTGLMFTTFIAIPTIILLFLVFPND